MAWTKEHEATLRYLRQQVDKAEAALARTDQHQDVKQDLWRAREELRAFVEQLRAEGFQI
jgi:hypothetical protein